MGPKHTLNFYHIFYVRDKIIRLLLLVICFLVQLPRYLCINFLCLAASPWETRRMKAELAEAKALNASLEERIKKLHSVRMELELVFDNEKTSFLKQRERDREIVSFERSVVKVY